MSLIVCLDCTYYTGSILYQFLFLSYIKGINVILTCPFYNKNDTLVKKYNIIPWDKKLVTADDILILNDIYCIQFYKDLEVKPRKTIMWFHNGYESMNDLVSEMVLRKTINFTTVEELKKIISNIDTICVVNKQQEFFFDRKAIIIPTPVIKIPYIKKRNVKLKLLSVGTFCPRKDQLTLISIYEESELNNEFALLGMELNHPQGKYLDYNKLCVSAAKKCKLYKSTDSKQFYIDYDIFVFLSKSEQAPLVILEALKYGLPVLTTTCGNVKDLIIDGVNGFIVTPDNIIEKLKIVINHYDEFSKNTLITLNKYYIEHISKIDLWKTIILYPKKIIIDFDNTIVDFETRFVERWNYMYDDNRKDMKFILGKKVHDDFFIDFYEKVIPLDNSIEALKELLHHNYIITIASVCENMDVVEQKKIWIRRYLGDVWVDRFIPVFTDDKSSLDFDILIDDRDPAATIVYKQHYNSGTFTWSQDFLKIISDEKSSHINK
jgi:glycosyltransferase involved in cell wall biosynthesis